MHSDQTNVEIEKCAIPFQTLDECVRRKQPDCDVKYMWLQVPFFCGHAAECW